MTQVTFRSTIQNAAIASTSHRIGAHGNPPMHLLNLDERRFDHQLGGSIAQIRLAKVLLFR